jgi:uncharacterized HAD superfamily protein
MNQWIIFDVDDVVGMYRETLYQSFKKLGQDIHWSKWDSYKHVKIYGLKGYDEFLEHMLKHEIIENLALEEGVAKLIHQLKNEGYLVGFLTARSWHPNAYSITQNFAQKYNLPIDKIVIANFQGKKTDYLHEFESEIVGFLDDSPSHVEDFLAANIPNSYVMNRPWNQDKMTLPRIVDYQEFYDKFKKPKLKFLN